MITQAFANVSAELFGGANRTTQHIEQMVQLLRQAVGLLEAGRAPRMIWEELAPRYTPCTESTDAPAPDQVRWCCIRHVLDQQRTLRVLGRTPLSTLADPTLLTEDPEDETLHYWGQVAGVLRISDTSGMPLAVLLERLADAWEAGEDAHQARRAAAAGPMSTARLLMLLPLGGIGVSAMLGSTVFGLLESPVGWVLLTLGIGFAALGRWWISRLLKAAEHV